jgi:biotin-(acetyl-CoA carboxylase) ligase
VRRVGTSLADLTGKRFDLTDILLELAARLETRLAELAAADTQLVQAWQARCMLGGRSIELADGTAGRCVGIDADGALLLESDGDQRSIYSGVLQAVGPDDD